MTQTSTASLIQRRHFGSGLQWLWYLTLSVCPMSLAANDDGKNPDELITYVYATWIGSGVYKVKGRSVAMLRLPFRYTLKNQEGERAGLRVLLPVTVGLHRFTGDTQTVGSVAFVPGIEYEIPIRENLRIKPFLQAGFGKDLSGGDTAGIYGAGNRTRYTIPWKRFEFSLGNTLGILGHSVWGGGNSELVGMFELGVEALHPTSLRLGGEEIDMSAFFYNSHFILSRLDFPRDDGEDPRVKDLYHFGISIGSTEPYKLWKFTLPRVGITYTFGDDNLTGIRFNTGFPF